MLRKALLFLLSGALVFPFLITTCWSAVEWNLENTLKMENKPVDIVVSADGKYTFVLTDTGKINVYSAQGTLEETIDAGKGITGLQLSPTGDKLYLVDRGNNAVQIFSLEFIQQINITGSPFKGPADAPVVIAIFSDFQ